MAMADDSFNETKKRQYQGFTRLLFWVAVAHAAVLIFLAFWLL